MSIKIQYEIVKGMMLSIAEGVEVKLLVPKSYFMFAEEFKELDERIKEVEVNTYNGFGVRVII